MTIEEFIDNGCELNLSIKVGDKESTFSTSHGHTSLDIDEEVNTLYEMSINQFHFECTNAYGSVLAFGTVYKVIYSWRELDEYLDEANLIEDDLREVFFQGIADNIWRDAQYFNESYVGKYDSDKNFAEQQFEAEYSDFEKPYPLVIDWQETWEYYYTYYFFSIDGHYFKNI